MDKIQQLILDTYSSRPKHFTQILKRNKEVIEYVKEHASHLSAFLEQLYYSVYRVSNICKNGNVKSLKTFAGYSFCGKAGTCRCAKESVSKNVSSSKNLYTSEKIEQINKKRKETTLLLHGVVNNGQTVKAKEKHIEFYKDNEKVRLVVRRVKDTKLSLYGNENYNNRDKCEGTCLQKYGVKNAWSLREDKQNASLNILRDKDELVKIFPQMSVVEIAEKYKLHQQTIYWYLNKHGLREPYKSVFEKEIVYFLETLGVTNIVTNKRTIIGKELDIFLPDYNLAIEYNGVFWHHDKIQHITRTYHRDKFIECEKKNIELFTIFSDSWETKKDIWKNKIRSKVGKYNEKIYARNTILTELRPAKTREILDTNHVQGYTTSQYCYGLLHNGEIVAVMTFSKNRAGIGKNRGEGSYELVRYVTSKPVIGGASKLLKHFIKVHTPLLIVSYSDNQYSNGKLYRILGFELENDNTAGYKYYNSIEKKMYHRYKFAKHNLVKLGFDKSRTEFEITDELGLLRIWDCGTRTWVLTI